MSLYRIEIQEASKDLAELDKNNYDLVLSRSVIGSDGTQSFNVIFHSSGPQHSIKISPTVQISWYENYALNYSQTVSTPGTTVTVGGEWQSFSPNDSNTINSDGIWESTNPSTRPTDGGFHVLNHYQPVHIVVGIKIGTSYVPMWFDPHQLLMDVNGVYRPTEAIKLWFAEDQTSGTIISTQSSAVELDTLTAGTTRYYHYDTTNGSWAAQSTPFNL